MDNKNKLEKLRLVLYIALVYAILSQILPFSSATNELVLFLLLVIQIIIGIISWTLAYEIGLSEKESIIIGVISVFTFVNIFSIIYILKKSSDYISDNKEKSVEDFVESNDSEEFIAKNDKDGQYEKTGSSLLIAMSVIVFGTLIVVSFIFIYKNTTNNMLEISNLKQQVEKLSLEIKSQDEELYDHESIEMEEEKKIEDTFHITEEENNNEDYDIYEITQLEVMGHEIDKSNDYMWIVTGTIKNNSDIEQGYDVQVIFLNSSNEPIALEEDGYMRIKPGEMNGFKVTLFDNISKVKDYEINIIYNN